MDEAKAFFTKIATKYKDSPNIIYEIFNEPDEESWEEVKAYSIEMIQTIRAIDPDNVIIVGTPHWDQDIHLAAEDPITGYDNIMYAVHFYAGTHKKWLMDRCDAALAKGLPLFVSECAGMEASGDGPIDTGGWNAWTKWMTLNHISWAAWSISNKEESGSMLVPTVAPDLDWTEKDLTPWAFIVKNRLRIDNK